MKWSVVFCATSLMLTGIGAAQQPRTHEPSSAGVRKHVFVDGKPIPANQVIVKEGVSYVDASVLAQALGASVKQEEAGVIIRAEKPSCDCNKTNVEGEKISEQFRSDVAGVADEIESLRAVVLKKEKVELAPRFDAIDRKLTLSTVHVQSDADMALYYALSYANNSLAITYYKLSRGVPAEDAQKNQLDSMMCAMESKFALMKGVLLPGGSCSVFQRMEAQQPLKPAEPSQ